MACEGFAKMVMDLRSHKTVTHIRVFEIPTRQYRFSMVKCPPRKNYMRLILWLGLSERNYNKMSTSMSTGSCSLSLGRRNKNMNYTVHERIAPNISFEAIIING